MEYCAAGSLSDINDAIHRVLTEEELKATIAYSVLGLHHLHKNRSIHRVSIKNYYFFFIDLFIDLLIDLFIVYFCRILKLEIFY